MNENEAHERAEEALHGHAHATPMAKRLALLIVVLAALLAVNQVGAKSAQNLYTASNIEAANLWSFYQAKKIRETTVETALQAVGALLPEKSEAVAKLLSDWQGRIDHFRSEPAKGEGEKELTERAQAKEHVRDHALETYHLFEFGGAAFELAIVLASAATITGIAWLAFVSGGVGTVGLALTIMASLL